MFAIKAEHHPSQNYVEGALIARHPDMWRSRGFISSYISGRRGKGKPDPKAIKLIADYLHVTFEWLMLGSGSMRRDGRGQTPAEMAMFTARDFGIRTDAWDVAWERNKDREALMSASDWFDAIRLEGERLERAGVPRLESIVADTDKQRAIRRIKTKKDRAAARAKGSTNDGSTGATDRARVAIGSK